MTLSKNSNEEKEKYYGGGPYKELKYCVRCCMPDSEEGASFDEMMMCPSCQSSEHKMHIDWTLREKQFRKILEDARAKALERKTYDILVPISGGKDSCFQLHILKKIYKMNILAVTFNQSWRTDTGKYNLENVLEKFDVDHFMFTPKRSAINKIARESLYQIGDACWHCHAGVGATPLQLAVKYRIPLLVWGESVAEKNARATHENPIKYDREYFIKISARKWPHEMINERSGLNWQDMLGYHYPSQEEIDQAGVYGIHLGDYYFWDEMRQVEFLQKEYGWKQDYVEGAYKQYKSVECRMAGVHDYAKFIKRGYGRTTDQASEDVRHGLMTREEAFQLIKELDGERPDELDYYLKITGFSEEEFHQILESQRVGNAKNVSTYKDFLEGKKK